jgi:hypothetical protein
MTAGENCFHKTKTFRANSGKEFAFRVLPFNAENLRVRSIEV